MNLYRSFVGVCAFHFSYSRWICLACLTAALPACAEDPQLGWSFSVLKIESLPTPWPRSLTIFERRSLFFPPTLKPVFARHPDRRHKDEDGSFVCRERKTRNFEMHLTKSLTYHLRLDDSMAFLFQGHVDPSYL